MSIKYFSERTCNLCGGHLARASNWCPACNRDTPSLRKQMTVLAITLVLFFGYCSLIYFSVELMVK